MDNLMDELLQQVAGYRSNTKPGPKSLLDKVLIELSEDALEEALARSFKVLANSKLENEQAAAIARRVAMPLCNISGIYSDAPKPVIRMGIEVLNWFAQLGLIQADKRKEIIEDGKTYKAVDVWFIKPLVEFPSDESGVFCDPRQPYVPWIGPTRYDSGAVVPIVKRSQQLGLLKEYTMDKIPMLYQALNRIGNVTWEINQDVLAYAQAINEDNSPLPKMPAEEDSKWAQAVLRNVKTSKAKRMRAYGLIGAREKRVAFDDVMDYAEAYEGYDLQFPHNLCGRGRIYALSPILNPQGADIAKALLVQKDKQPINKREFYIHTANCAGVDKETYNDRVKWTTDNLNILLAIGNDPLAAWDSIQGLGVHKEKKTYYQFIGCCMELAKLDIDPEHKTGMFLGLDSTSSGNQILAMLARDHEVAEYVNISMSDDGRPGDLYAYVGKYVKQALDSFNINKVSPKIKPHVNEQALQALAALPKGHKTFRKITKRICMVLPYSGTRFGAGEITKDDQYDHGSKEMDDLNFADCSVLGGIIYDQCESAAKRSMDLMAYMRSNLSTYETTITWRVPHTNFLAFQTKEKMTESSVEGQIANKKISLKVYLPTGKGNLVGHRNAISPGMVHSLDAAMLAMIINGIPIHLPVSAIHDQFCVPFGYMDVLMASARNAYANIADRELFLDMAESCFGERHPLPEPGKWRLDDLQDADYFIC